MSRTSLPVPPQQGKKSAVGRVLTSIRNKVKSSAPVAAPTANEGGPTGADPFQQVKSRIAEARRELALLVTNERAAPGEVTDILRASDDVLQRATKAEEFAAALQALKAGLKFAPAITVYANDRAAAAQARDTVSKLPNIKHRLLTEFVAQIDHCLNQADALYAAATNPEMIGSPCSLLQDMVAQIVPVAVNANKALAAAEGAIKKAGDALAPFTSSKFSEVLTAQSKVEAARTALEHAASAQEALDAAGILKGFDRDLKLVKRKCEQASQAPGTVALGDSPASAGRDPQAPRSGREYQPLPASLEALVEPPSPQDALQDSQADGTALPAGHGEHAAATSEIDPKESGRSGGHVEMPHLKESQPPASNDYGGSSDYGAFALGIKPASISELVEEVRRNLARNTTEEIQAAATLITQGERYRKVAFTGSKDIIKELTPEEFKTVCGYLQSNPELLEIGLQKCVEENLEIAAQALVNLPHCAEELQKKLTPEQRDQIVLKIEEFKNVQAEADRRQAERFESAKNRLLQLLDSDDIAQAADFLDQQDPAEGQLLRELLTQEQRDLIAAPPLVVKPSLRINPAPPVEALSLPTDRDEALRWLIADFERIMPIAERAQRALPPQDSASQPHELTKVKDEVAHGFEAGFQDGNPEQISRRLVELENLARQALSSMNIREVLKQQQASLPVAASELKKGNFLAEGNFAATYVLTGPNAPPLVAKVLKSSSGPDGAAEIDKEAEAYARLGDHLNIAKCYGKQLVEGSPALVMEQVQGGSATEVFNDLAQRYNKGDIDREKYLGAMQHMVHGILMGLSQFEAAGLAHRDIKGDNIRFDPVTNEPKILDMGLVQGQGSMDHGNFPFAWSPPEAFTTNEVGGQFDSFGLGQTIHQQLERPLGEQDPAEPWKVAPSQTEKVSEGTFFVPGKGTRARNKFSAGEYEAGAQQSIGPDGNPAVMPLTKASGDKASGAAVAPGAAPGQYGVATAYVDFMNRLLHPDPKQRMTPSEALRHPFMTDRLLDKDEVAKVLCPAKQEQPAEANMEQPAGTDVQQPDEVARRQHGELMQSIEKRHQDLPG